jgi:hypothetical protein
MYKRTVRRRNLTQFDLEMVHYLVIIDLIDRLRDNKFRGRPDREKVVCPDISHQKICYCRISPFSCEQHAKNRQGYSENHSQPMVSLRKRRGNSRWIEASQFRGRSGRNRALRSARRCGTEIRALDGGVRRVIRS